MNIPLLIFMLLLAFGAGYSFGIASDECPDMIRGYRCKGDRCNHSKYEVEKAKEEMGKNQPPTKFNFRP